MENAETESEKPQASQCKYCLSKIIHTPISIVKYIQKCFGNKNYLHFLLLTFRKYLALAMLYLNQSGICYIISTYYNNGENQVMNLVSEYKPLIDEYLR